MKDIVLCDAFTPDPDYEKKVHIDPYFGIWNNETEAIKIELLFDKSINTYILERTWHKNQICRQNEDGSVYLSFESNQFQESLYWILRFGSAVQILNPPELKDAYKAELKKMLKNVQ
jgi:predicted DNA-binding transcriptional regulator YafY